MEHGALVVDPGIRPVESWDRTWKLGIQAVESGFEQWNRGSGGESLAPAMGPGNRAVGPGSQ